jgi:hypothetical protein
MFQEKMFQGKNVVEKIKTYFKLNIFVSKIVLYMRQCGKIF